MTELVGELLEIISTKPIVVPEDTIVTRTTGALYIKYYNYVLMQVTHTHIITIVATCAAYGNKPTLVKRIIMSSYSTF